MAATNATPTTVQASPNYAPLMGLLRSSFDEIESLRDELTKLGALFRAIAHAPSDQTVKLADLGHFLAEDWSNDADVRAEQLRANLDQCPV